MDVQRRLTRPRRRVAGYELSGVIAEGAGGRVHLAHDVTSGRAAAVKRLAPGADADTARRLRREGELLAAIDHPNVMHVHAVVDDGDGVAVAMDYAAGGSLAERLVRRRRLPATEVVAFAAPIADALACAHRAGVVHRDVKPANILFTAAGEPVLSDFGIARWAKARGLTAAGTALGTAGYLDPAAADGGVADERSDVYALGVVCYEALAGTRPFRGPTDLAVLRSADRGEHRPLCEAAPDAPPGLVAVVERAMARDPADRYATAIELAAAVRAGCDATAPTTRAFGPRPPVAAPKRAAAPGRRRRVLVIGTALVAAIGALVACRAALGPANRRPSPRTHLASSPCSPFAAGPECRPVTASGNVIEVGGAGRPVRFQLGQPGDVALVGDWSCHGRHLPALYRPGTGDLFTFSSWARPGRVARPRVARQTGVIAGRPVVRRVPGGCDRVDVVGGVPRR